MGDSKITRRAFLAAATTTAVLTASGRAFGEKPNTARVVPRKLSPNEKMNVAAIGAGGKGQSDILSCKRENIVALCDVDWDRAAETAYRLEKDPENKGFKKYDDFRKMLEEMPEIDAVTISTPDHMHAPAAYMAMNLGKHVYVQKPLTHTILEARLLLNTARETKVTTQMGNQGHCGDGVRDMCEIIWSGAIGGVQEAHVWTNRPVWPQGIADPLPEMEVPSTMNWDLWLGTAPARAYNKGYAPFNWRGWWDYGCGAVGDMACHIFDPAFWALKLYEAKTFSVELVSQEGVTEQTAPNKSVIKYQFPARGDMPPVDVYWYDGGELPARPESIPANEKLGDSDGKNGSLFIGTDGIATTGTYGGDTRLVPSEKMKDFKKPEQTIPRVEGENPYRDWLEAAKAGRAATTDFEYAVPLTVVANLGNIAVRTGRKLQYDVDKWEFTGDAEATGMLTKEYRKGWELPV